MFIPKTAMFTLLMALTSGGAQAETPQLFDAEFTMFLGPLSPLAIALDGLLPQDQKHQLASPFWQIVKQAAIVPTGSSEAFLVTCKTQGLTGRVPDPLGYFQGCKVAPIKEIPDNVEVLTLGDLFTGAFLAGPKPSPIIPEE